LTFPFPVVVIARLLGLAREDLPMFHRQAVEMISAGFEFDRAIAASNALYDYFCAIIADRRAHPSDDVISVLVQAELDGERLDGVAVPAGSIINVNIGSATHDGRYWENAEEFDIFRAPRQHIAFAWGPHMCLGLHLARMETRVALTRVLDRLPNLRLDPDAEQ